MEIKSRQSSPFDMLPKEILINIVSRVPFKEAVRTSVLAKRWINLWRYSTIMELNQGLFRNPNLSSSDPEKIRSVQFRVYSQKFMRYFLGSELESFSLIADMTDKSLTPMLRRAVLFAIKNRVKHLTLDLSNLLWNQESMDFKTREFFDLQNEFYDHLPSIASLKLSSFSVSLLGCSFTSMRRASFQWIRFWKADLKHLAAEAPLLEDLRLHRCIVYKIKLASNSLKSLGIEECDVVKDTISLTTPNLKSFVFSGRASILDLESASRSLENASVRFDLQPKKADLADNVICQQFKNFCHVKDLTICSYILQLLPTKMEDFNELHLELNHLTIIAASFNISMLQGVAIFVKSCHHMETLTIDLSKESHCLTGRWQALLDDEPYIFRSFEDARTAFACLIRSLRVIEIKGYEGESRLLMEFLRIFVMFGEVLEKIIWKSSTNSREIVELQKLEKASPGLQICGV
ncbi:hypothetical protein QQ045_011802 [Rhodiola kirilowii]